MRLAALSPLLLLLVAGALPACGGGEAAAVGPGGMGHGGPGGGEKRPVPVRIEAAAEGALSRTLERTGTLRTDADIEIAPRYSGRLVDVPVQIGDGVAKGQLLARLDDREIRRSRQEADAGLEVAAAALVTARIDQERSRRELERFEALADEGLVTAQQADDTRTAAASADAALDLAAAQSEQAHARLESLRLQESETRLVAPFAGIVADRTHDAGDTVAAGATVLRLVGDGPLRARVQVPDRDAVLLAAGAPVEIRVDAFPGEVFPGSITGIAPAVDPDTGTVAVEAGVDEDHDRLLPGMFARIRVKLPEREHGVLVPAEAVLDHPEDGCPALYIVASGTATLTSVVTGVTEGGRTEILEGLTAGTPVVVSGQHLLRDGARVEVLGGDGAGTP